MSKRMFVVVEVEDSPDKGYVEPLNKTYGDERILKSRVIYADDMPHDSGD